MKLWVFLTLTILWVELQNGFCQQFKRRKEAGENRNRSGGKRIRVRYPKLREKEAGGKGPSLLTQVLDKGRFLRLGESASLTPGNTLELRCKGDHIGWSYPSNLDTFNDSRLSIKQSDKHSQLILTSPSAADTGTYSCWVILCDGSECHQDPDRIFASYLYFPDKDSLFVPSAIYFEIVYLRPNRPAVVPCRVTVPQARVSLHREVPPEEIPANGTQVTYDPTRGFVLKSPGMEHQGVFYCRAVTRVTPQVSTKYQLLYVEAPSGPPFVTLEPSSSSAWEGDTINITCTVLGEPEADVSVTWSYPGQGDHRPVGVQTTWRLIKRGAGHITRITHSVITVDDLDSTDFGRYVCRAKNSHGETAVSTAISSNRTRRW